MIVLCSSDGSSARAIDNLGALICGWGLLQEFQSASFAQRARRFGMSLPLIHRFTQYDRKGGSKVFRAMLDEIKKRAETVKKGAPRMFP